MANEGGGGNSNTILVVALIFSVLIAIGGIFFGYSQNSEVEKHVEAKKKAEKEITLNKEKIKALTLDIEKANRLIIGASQVDYESLRTKYIKDARTTLETTLKEEWVTKEDIDLIQDTKIKDAWNRLLEYRRRMPEYNNLTDLYNDLQLQIKAVIHLIPRLRAQRVQKIEELNAAKAQFEKERIESKRFSEDLSKQLQDTKDKVDAQAREFDVKKRELEEELTRLRDDKAREEKIKKLEIAKLESEKKTLEQRIREINKKERRTLEVSGADGEVIHSDPSLGFAWINLGKNQNLRPGMTFQVFRTIKGGRIRIKGKVIVKTVEANMAKATIIADAQIRDPDTGKMLTLPLETDPIVKGDLIRTPLFDRTEQQSFVFLGDKVTNPTYKRAELERKIEEAGGKVEKAITIGTDFVVLLGGAEELVPDEIEKAAQFGVIFMREDELLEYLTR